MSAIKSAAILVAAGLGERLVQSTAGKPKQFIDLAGVPLFIWSLTTLIGHSEIEQAVLAVPEGWQDHALNLISQYLPKSKDLIKVIVGGSTRQESVWLALEQLAQAHIIPLYVIIHDAARPFVTTGSIDQIFAQLKNGSSVTLAIPLSDSLKKSQAGKIIEDVDRSAFMLVQTPQAAQFETMLSAHRQARLKDHMVTDDAAILKFYGLEVIAVPGSRINLKITEPEDLIIAEALVKHNNWTPAVLKS